MPSTPKSKVLYKSERKWVQGDKNKNWKGDNAGYRAIHLWLTNNFGKANKCENELCKYPRRNRGWGLLTKPKGFEWAIKHGETYTHNRDKFMMLCKSCHHRYDLSPDHTRKPKNPKTISYSLTKRR